ncbi:MAG: hypothetical protein LBP59_09870 [Planctomycetaceae bacterium]|jgi:hypothetical protein|nr:hypothetical protein [Planctomycetaceae bacterium]
MKATTYSSKRNAKVNMNIDITSNVNLNVNFCVKLGKGGGGGVSSYRYLSLLLLQHRSLNNNYRYDNNYRYNNSLGKSSKPTLINLLFGCKKIVLLVHPVPQQIANT